MGTEVESDYEAIRQLAARYAIAMDRRDLDALVGTFVEDYRHWNGEIGREAVRGASGEPTAPGAARPCRAL
jgi:hypothetical protein